MDDPQPTNPSSFAEESAIATKHVSARLMVRSGVSQFFGALAFYTVIPLPQRWTLEFQTVARWVVVVGILLGSLLGFLDLGLSSLGMPALTRSAVIVAVWVWITGGLHLDGAMDTADGLAVQDPQRRLQVMSDSATGAFGAIAGILLLLLKTAALTDLHYARGLALVLAAGWGRWGQQVAIARYPYLKLTGKGAFHQAAIRSLWDCLPSLLLMLGLSALPVVLDGHWEFAVVAMGGGAIAPLTAAWLNRRLGGHTGDTYGAVVEWTEALFLVLLTAFWA
ncbi:MAG TPA: adenosylcobinamide-GDP ribazoletransferase [Crinalium sp.]|jgi:adenosylcobinamide-GDP ribazoletransferase